MSTKKLSQRPSKARKGSRKLKDPLSKPPKVNTKSCSVFKLDSRFIRELHARILNHRKEFLGSHYKGNKTEFFPSQNQLEQIILAMFWASLKTEEGRLSRFRVTFAQPLPINYLSLIFEKPKLLNVEEFRKIAPAVLPPNGQVVVWPHGKSGDLHIWGLQTTDLIRVSIEAVESGRITVNYMTSIIAEITGQRTGFISSEWNRQGLQMMGICETQRKSISVNEALSFLGSRMTQEILSRMRLLGHGGAIIFVPEGNKWARSVEQPLVYACDQPFNVMGQVVEHFVKKIGEVTAKSINDDSVERQVMQVGMNLISSYEYKAFIGDAARSIAYLSAVDGTTILNYNFKVLAFGAKLKAPKKGARAETVISISPLESDSGPEEVPIDDEFRGTRHLSAAQFVFNNHGSVAFVVSQDGGITGLMMGELDGSDPTPKLLAYRGLELLL